MAPRHAIPNSGAHVALPGNGCIATLAGIKVQGMPDVAFSKLANDQDFIVFDGECVLCSRFFQFMINHDTAQRFKFATAQSPLGQELYTELGLPTDDYETNLVVVRGRVYRELDAFAAAMRALPGPWPVLSLCRFLPAFLKGFLYRAIARNRYNVFGRSEACLIPDQKIVDRFMPGGF